MRESVGQPGVWAISELGGSNIYVNAARWVGGMKSNMATLMHEVLHNITGKTDDQLQDALKLKVQDDTSNISHKLQKDCIK
jgi:ribosomal protein S2